MSAKRISSVRALLFSAVFPLLACLAILPLRAQEWTRFRGPNGSGISYAKTVPTKLGEANLTWKSDLPGSGHSSPVLWGERLFLTCTGDKSGGISVLCFGARDGKLLWKRDFPLSPFVKHANNSFASATPTVDAERVYVVWNEPDHYFLTAFNHSGKTQWQRDFGVYVSQHGCGASPILCDDKVILPNFQDDPEYVQGPMPDPRTGKSSIIAVSAKTGETVWQTPRRSTVVAYSTPCLWEPKEGMRAVIFNSQSHGISALDPRDGKVLWEYDGAFAQRTVSSPVVFGDLIFGSCGSGAGRNVFLAINAKGASPEHKPKLAYDLKKAAAYVPCAVAMGSLVWQCSDGGIVTCLNSENGEPRYQERVGGNFFGSPLWIDGRIFCVSKSGEVVTIEASDKFNLLHRFPLNEICESTPAVALGHLFIRTDKHLWCFGEQKSNAAP